jgi:hypothetical protein
MKIRSLKEYVKLLTSHDTTDEHSIGSPEEPLLRRFYGEDDNIDRIIASVANFASDAEEQIFYEFVQNAYDASADALLFYANEHYLLVVNNGNPFYTDEESRHKGQLREFLSKNKTAKFKDDELMGKYGQGSKLLYKFIGDTSIDSEEKSQLKAIKEEKKGPYILSWYNDIQLYDFLYKNGEWEYQDPRDEKKGLLLAKIIYTYYPVAPGEYPDLFSEDEVDSIRNAFNCLVNPERNKNLLTKGSVLIVPLGKGKYQKLKDPNNISKVKERLSGVVSLIGDKQDRINRISRLAVLGETIDSIATHSVFINCFIEGETSYEYQFAFNENFARDGYANFFKHLPIANTQFNLGFIVNCADFEVDNGRQNIMDKDKTEQQLSIAFEELSKELNKKDRDF